MKKYLYIIYDNMSCKQFTNFKILPDNYLQIEDNEPYPIEDSNYLLSNDNMSENEALDLWISKL